MARIIQSRSIAKGTFLVEGATAGQYAVFEGSCPPHVDPSAVKPYASLAECEAENTELALHKTRADARVEHKNKWAKHDQATVYQLKTAQARRVMAGETSGFDLVTAEATLRGISPAAMASMILAIAEPLPTLEADELARIAEKLSMSS